MSASEIRGHLGDPDLAAAWAANFELSDEIVEDLIFLGHHQALSALAVRADLPARYVRALSHVDLAEVLTALARRTDPLDEGVLRALAGSTHSEAVCLAAGREELPDDLVYDLIWHEDPKVAAVIAGRRQLPDEYLVWTLLGRGDLEVDRALAEREDLPVSMLDQLASSPDPQVVKAVARREDLPKSTMEILATSWGQETPDGQVVFAGAAALAEREDLDLEIGRMLDEHHSEQVRAIRMNANQSRRTRGHRV